jgi:hypothetical protein
MTDYKTCTHIHDNGHYCQSAAVTDRDYCLFHLRYRARQLRKAQARARMERFDLKLPPIESMSTVLSAINQLVEAVAADMIDLKRADFLLKSLRFAAQALKSSDKWQPSVYHSDQPAPAVDLATEYGLPNDLDLNTRPEVAFPPADTSDRDGCPVQADFACAGVFPHGVHPLPPNLDRPPLIPIIPPPVLRDYVAEAEIAMNEVTPQDLELHEIMKTEGYKAMESRALEHERDANRKRRRKLYRANYERYVAEAKLKNIQRAAEKLLAQRLAAEKTATSQTPQADSSDAKKPPASVAPSEPETNAAQSIA